MIDDSNDFMRKPCCKCNLEYGIAWFFFIIGNGFFISMILVNPLNLDLGTGSEKNVVKFIFCSFFFFIVSFITRIMCRTRHKEYYDSI